MTIQHRYVYDPANANLTGFASNVTGATWTLTATAATDGFAHQVSIRNDSVTNHSAKTATLVGTDYAGAAQTEVMNLPNTSATVESTKYFKTLTSITPSASIGADTMDIGWVDEYIPTAIMLNHNDWVGALIQVVITGTITCTFEVTAAARQYIVDGTALWSNTGTSGLVNLTGSVLGQLEPHLTAARLKVASYTDGALITVYVSESSIER